MGEKRGRGRPAKIPNDVMTLDQAIQMLRDYLLKLHKNEDLADRLCPAKQTLYNKISKKELHRYGKTMRPVLVSFEEVKRLVS